ncbi:MAG: hypothetical protein MUC74_07395 [Ideonella sp.]|jgi:hypothetical protein|nr:hypothetical protein [Ideonella sp.]
MSSRSPRADFVGAGPIDVEREQMRQHDISSEGAHCLFGRHRYLKLDDARLRRERAELPSRGHDVADPLAPPVPAGRSD